MPRTQKRKPRPQGSVPGHGRAAPSALQRLLVRQGLGYDDAAVALRKFAKGTISVSSGYLSKVANGQPPSLKLGRVIVRWTKSLREELTLADLGIELA